MRKLIFYIACFCFSTVLFAQDKDHGTVADSLDTDEEEGWFFELDDVVVYDKMKFATYEQKVNYYILRRKVHKVYPYAKLAAERLQNMNRILDTLSSKSLKKVYTKRMQDYIENEFKEELKKLTKTEGQILVKLIHRQTGDTAYGLLKELRSGWSAFWYNTTANMFDISLKEEFDPEDNIEDFLIEDILQRAFAAGTLQKQKDALGIDYDELVKEWKEK